MIEDDDQETLNAKTYTFDDYQRLRQNIRDKVKKAVGDSFPLEWGGVRLEVKNLKYDPTDYDLKKQKDALLKDEYLANPLKGDVYLYDSKSNQLLDQLKGKTLMRVPYYTERGTFIHNGNEYSTLRQMRLRPGIYSRRKANNELETQFNIERGTGRGYRITFDPKSSIYKFEIGQSSVSLYSILHDIGVPDQELKEAWGDDVFARNKSRYDRRALDKVHSKMVSSRNSTAKTFEDKARELREAFEAQRVDADIRKSTLGF